MKTIKYLFIIVAFLFVGIANAQKNYLAPADTPAQISKYVKQHFPDGQIVYVKKKDKLHYTKYKVKLDTQVELEFDGDFNIYEIESKSPLPASVIPPKIQHYVSQHYPTHQIKEWELKKNGQKVELTNDVDLLFDREGNFLKID